MAEQTRRHFLGTWLGTAALVTAGSALNGCATALETVLKETSGKNGRYETIAHNFLDIESPDLGVVDSDYQVLDDIIDEAKERINKIKLDKPFAEYTKEEAVDVLKTIDKVLGDKGFGYQRNDLLNQGLKSEKIDCDNRSVISLGIADVLGLPLKAVNYPKHVFVRWHFDKDNYINWEITRGKEVSDEKYKSWKNIPDISIENGIFLRSLSRKEFYSIAYDNRGIALRKLKRYKEAIKSHNMALKLNPNDPDLYISKGYTSLLFGRNEEAFKNYNIAHTLDPVNYPAIQIWINPKFRR